MITKELVEKIYAQSLAATAYVEKITMLLEPEDDDSDSDSEVEALIAMLGAKGTAKPKPKVAQTAKKAKPLTEMDEAVAKLTDLCGKEEFSNIKRSNLCDTMKRARDKIEAFIDVLNKRAGMVEDKDQQEIIVCLQEFADSFRALAPTQGTVLSVEMATQGSQTPAPKPVLFANTSVPKSLTPATRNELYNIICNFGRNGGQYISEAIFKTTREQNEYLLLHVHPVIQCDDIAAHIRVDRDLVAGYEHEKWHLTVTIKGNGNKQASLHYYYSSKPFPRLTTAPRYPLNFAVDQYLTRNGTKYFDVIPAYKEDTVEFQRRAVDFIANCRAAALEEANRSVSKITLKAGN